MKKSEKIEIRISPEDKEALSRRAEAEGRPASEVVRDLLQSGGVTAQARTVPEGPPRTALYVIGAGLLASGLFFGFLLGLLPGGGAAEPMMSLRFSASGDGAGEVLPYREATLTLPAGRLDGAQVFIATGPQAGYRLIATSDAAGGGVELTQFHVCRETDGDCEPLAAPSLTRAPGTRASVRTEAPGGPSFAITLHPQVPPEEG